MRTPTRTCRVYWGSHSCDLRRGHLLRRHRCICCDCGSWWRHWRYGRDEGCVGRWPYYGLETSFYGEDSR